MQDRQYDQLEKTDFIDQTKRHLDLKDNLYIHPNGLIHEDNSSVNTNPF